MSIIAGVAGAYSAMNAMAGAMNVAAEYFKMSEENRDIHHKKGDDTWTHMALSVNVTFQRLFAAGALNHDKIEKIRHEYREFHHIPYKTENV